MNRTKAQTLAFLRDRKLKESFIEDMYHFTAGQWKQQKETILKTIARRFLGAQVAIRSSALNEDTAASSLAGYYVSKLDICSGDAEAVFAGIEEVIESYKRSDQDYDKYEVLVQRQVEDILMSGVVFTRHNKKGSPYYVIDYDDRTGRTDTVTSGCRTSHMCVSRFADMSQLEQNWRKLLSAVREVEGHFPGIPLDIEFGYTRSENVAIFQVRPLVIHADEKGFVKEDKALQTLLDDITHKFRRLNVRIPHLCGDRTILCDMSDWNPAEIIGDRPKTLDYSLYGYIVTDAVWHHARTTMGYKDVAPGELMISLAKKPYIDTRLSINSFLPASLDRSLQERLTNFYLSKLERCPEEQDKIEFNILWTCFDFTLEEDIQELSHHGFSTGEINTIVQSLKSLTEVILKDYDRRIREDLKRVETLTRRRDNLLKDMDVTRVSVWEIFTSAHYILESCKYFGTLPFSRLARLGFMARQLLMSLSSKGVVTEEQVMDILASIDTVATHFKKDLRALQKKEMEAEEFLSHYGHLRIGTYDITAPTYKDIFHVMSQKSPAEAGDEQRVIFQADDELRKRVDAVLEQYSMPLKSGQFFDFVTRATASREKAKFEFTKSLSSAIDLLAAAGEKLGFSREEMSCVDYPTLMKFRNPEYNDETYAKKMIRHSINRHRRSSRLFDHVLLPPVVCSEKDLKIVRCHKVRPNFVTNKMVEGELIAYHNGLQPDQVDLSGKIVVIENADPGYDWIFTQEPKALITRFGGIASHMAIRCAEFSLPAAIGCGEEIYRRLESAAVVRLDCGNRKLEILDQYA